MMWRYYFWIYTTHQIHTTTVMWKQKIYPAECIRDEPVDAQFKRFVLEQTRSDLAGGDIIAQPNIIEYKLKGLNISHPFERDKKK